MNRHLKIVSWNVKCLNHPVKRRKVLASKTTQNRNSLHARDSYLFQSLSARTFPLSHIMWSDKFGWNIIVTGKLYNTLVVFINVYTPNLGDVSFWEVIFITSRPGAVFTKLFILPLGVLLTSAKSFTQEFVKSTSQSRWDLLILRTKH